MVRWRGLKDRGAAARDLGASGRSFATVGADAWGVAAMISARVASLVGFVFAVVFAWLPPSSARAQDGQPFQVWINTAQCSMTRAGWLAVAQDSPGFGWTHSPGSSPQFTMVGALALLDALRINTCQADSTSCPAFKNYCCPVVV